MTRNAKNIFLEMIGYNADKFTSKADGVNERIILEMDEKDKDHSSYYDRSYFNLTGDHLIHINNLGRSTKELLFDYYHEIGHILVDKNLLNDKKIREWLDTHSEYKSVVNGDLTIEMMCDAHAAKNLGYDFTVAKMLPFKKVTSEQKLHPDASEQDIKIYVQSTNNTLTVRRKYLEYLISEYAPLTPPKKKKSDGNAEWSALSSTSKKIMPRFRVHQIVKELAEGCGIDTEPETFREQTAMQLAMTRMRITFSSRDDFQTLVTRTINAIKGNTNSMFNIPQHKYVLVREKPDNWETNYTKYYRFDDKLSAFMLINKLEPEVDENGKTKLDENGLPKQTRPLFGNNVYRQEKVNVQKEIDKLKLRYKRLVEDFLEPKFEEYKKLIHISDRNMMQFIIEQCMVKHLEGDLPTMSEIASMKDEYRGVKTVNNAVKSSTVGMLSYKERVKIAKENHKILPNESMEEYDKRINLILNEEFDKMNTKPQVSII